MPLSYFIGWIIAIAAVIATLWMGAAKPTYATADRVNGIDTRLTKVESAIDKLDERLDAKLDRRFDSLPAQIASELRKENLK
jgi:hypothetical protein